ncbi:GDP-L-fucose synthase [Rosistilla carotiformis]|uniref:GDP-L-fucose synthase n=1 Tax=Rosistilla carotiformis TaxID=2528017 RepID=A0A518JRU2_9BACT|nr:GDP-L-fucose synthase [Rosistilla carotiformis]QDV68258.1 GDP-L-fucose synthase [Rosistilla carotiformis]
MNANSTNPPIHRLFVAGHRGMVGDAICRNVATDPSIELLTAGREVVDLCDAEAVDAYYAENRPDAVVVAAAKVGGIFANSQYPVQFMSDNLKIAVNCIESAYRHGVRRLLFLGSTCIYPRDAAQPLVESALLSGPLESTNEAYAIAKIAGLKLCQYYRQQYGVMFHSAMPTNLYGPGDNYHPENSHVLPALLRRFHEAKEEGTDSVTIWGSGSPRREFLYVDDLAAAVMHLITAVEPPDWVNVGTGEDLTILELAKKIAAVVGFEGEIKTDPTKPDGTPRKVTDVTRIHKLGWRHQVELDQGLRQTYTSFLKECAESTMRQA